MKKLAEIVGVVPNTVDHVVTHYAAILHEVGELDAFSPFYRMCDVYFLSFFMQTLAEMWLMDLIRPKPLRGTTFRYIGLIVDSTSIEVCDTNPSSMHCFEESLCFFCEPYDHPSRVSGRCTSQHMTLALRFTSQRHVGMKQWSYGTGRMIFMHLR